jgi:hypothetical protein
MNRRENDPMKRALRLTRKAAAIISQTPTRTPSRAHVLACAGVGRSDFKIGRHSIFVDLITYSANFEIC